MKVSHTQKDSEDSADIQLYHGDCLEELKGLPENSFDSCVTDPPYHLTPTSGGKSNMEDKVRGNIQAKQFVRLGKGFMGKEWDGGDIAFRPDVWREIYRVLKPGAHLLAFGGTRTQHRMVCAIEDAGFEIRDQIPWLYGQGFPKNFHIGKQIGGNWQGWGTALKPANEPIVLARKPLSEKTVVANVLCWGTGALNIGACRVPANDKARFPAGVISQTENVFNKWGENPRTDDPMPSARFPANVIHDGSDEVLALFPETSATKPHDGDGGKLDTQNQGWGFRRMPSSLEDNGGSAARFFYSAKANSKERNGSKHPTVKPIALMRYLCRLITPPGGTVLDPFAGTGTTGQAALEEKFRAVLIEKEAEYIADITRRIDNIPANLKDFMRPSDGTQTVCENQQEQVSNDNAVDWKSVFKAMNI